MSLLRTSTARVVTALEAHSAIDHAGHMGLCDYYGEETVRDYFSAAGSSDESRTRSRLEHIGYGPRLTEKIADLITHTDNYPYGVRQSHLPPALEAATDAMLIAVGAESKNGDAPPTEWLARSANEVRERFAHYSSMYGSSRTGKNRRSLLLLAAFGIEENIAWLKNGLIETMSDAEVIDTALHRQQRLERTFGLQDCATSFDFDRIVAKWDINDQLNCTLNYGYYEASLGWFVNLWSGISELARIGFQENEKAFQIVQLIGGKPIDARRDQAQRDFRRFSGGVAALPWLSYVIGRSLLDGARSTNRRSADY